MKSAERTTALQKRVLLANKHWGLFFSKLPYRAMGFRSLGDAPLEIIARTAENMAAISAVDLSITNNLLGDEPSQELTFAL